MSPNRASKTTIATRAVAHRTLGLGRYVNVPISGKKMRIISLIGLQETGSHLVHADEIHVRKFICEE